MINFVVFSLLLKDNLYNLIILYGHAAFIFKCKSYANLNISIGLICIFF